MTTTIILVILIILIFIFLINDYLLEKETNFIDQRVTDKDFLNNIRVVLEHIQAIIYDDWFDSHPYAMYRIDFQYCILQIDEILFFGVEGKIFRDIEDKKFLEDWINDIKNDSFFKAYEYNSVESLSWVIETIGEVQSTLWRIRFNIEDFQKKRPKRFNKNIEKVFTT